MEQRQNILEAEQNVNKTKVESRFNASLNASVGFNQVADKFGDAYRLMGICQLKLNRREEGLAHLKKAAELGDESAQAILTEEETKQ